MLLGRGTLTVADTRPAGRRRNTPVEGAAGSVGDGHGNPTRPDEGAGEQGGQLAGNLMLGHDRTLSLRSSVPTSIAIEKA
jgi:hypothetical protein